MPTSRTLICLALAAGAAAGEALRLEAPGASTQLGAGGVITVAGSGFAARRGDWLVSGDSVRWDQANNLFWASGGIVFVLPEAGIRLHADRIGLHPDPVPNQRTGDAWEVEAWLNRNGRQMRIRAARVELHEDRLTFHDVEADLGNGAAVVLHCPLLHAYLREKDRTDKDKVQPARYLEGVAAVRPWVSVAGVPTVWLPYLYRDFVIDYPWSTFEAGSEKRLGTWARYRVGGNLKDMDGWRTRVVGRVDRYSRAGNGYGLEGFWRNQTWGRGSVTWYRMPKERVMDPVDGSWSGEQRNSNALDLEHYVSGRGWAAAARWTEVPPADPAKTLPDQRPTGDRFRSDFLHEDLVSKPFARRGLATAWTTPFGGITVDTEHRPVGEVAGTERLAGVDAELNRTSLLGPLAFTGDAQVARLERETWDPVALSLTPSAATRTTWDGKVAASEWIGGLGLDGSAGMRGVAWGNGSIAGSAVEGNPSTAVPYLDAGMRLRMVANWGDITHALTPRLGVEMLAAARGSGNPGYDFGDALDNPDQDRRYLVTGIETTLSGGSVRSFTGSLVGRWGLRASDTWETEVDGTLHHSSGRLVEVTATASGKPHADVDASVNADWDFRLGRWTALDANVAWRVLGGPLSARYQGTYIPPTATTDSTYQNQPGLSLQLARYRVNGYIDLRRNEGPPIDLWHIGLVRRGVDGLLTLSYEVAHDQPDGSTDHRVALGFAIGGDGDEEKSGLHHAIGGL